ncbi:hypothetical protein ACFWYW_55890 [Nonomuraea sp. NPDC059023]|uniref:hypothetical protein n=1 Tax=unclassified Nonomuraea TaxID=2593643 RepID=UPI0036B8A6DD
MPTRDLVIALKSQWDGSGTNAADKGLKKTEDSSRALARELERMEKQARQQAAAMTQNAAATDRFGQHLEDVGRTAIRTRKLLEDATKRLPEIEITADSSNAERRVADVVRRLRELRSQRIGIDIDASDAAAETERLRRDLTQLAAMNPEIFVDANVERALRDLEKVEREARNLAGRDVTVDVNVSGASASATAIGLIQNALAMVRSSGPAAGIAVGAALIALPAASALAANAITVGLGGALAGLGLAASHGSDAAQDAIGQLKEAVKRESAVMGQPFERVWTTIAQVAERELVKLSPIVRRALDNLAPDVQDFVEDTGDSLGELEPAIDGIERAFSAVLQQLGPRMPQIMQHLAAAISAVTDAVEENPELLADVAVNMARIAEWTGNAVASLSRFAIWIRENTGVIKALMAVLNPASLGLAEWAEGAAQAGRANDTMAKSAGPVADGFTVISESADEASAKMREGWTSAYASFVQLGQVMSSVQQRASSTNSFAQAQERAAEVQRQGAERIARAERELADVQEQSAERIAAAKQRVKDARRAAAQAAEDAQERIRDAQEAVTAAEEEGARRVAEAQQRVEDARERVAQAAEESSRRIEDAERRLADASADAAARQVDAERRVQDAHRRTEDAVEDLTAARARAQERLEDLIAAESGAALDEEGAALAIERARQRMQEINDDSESDDLDRREAELAYRQAIERLNEVRRRNEDLRQELADARARGIEGSAEVVDAIGRVEDARRAEGEAAEAAARQREESARTIADAERALADAHADAARQQADASRALADAEAELDRARAESARSVRDAQKEVADAQADAAQVAKDSARTVAEAQAEAARAVRDASRDVLEAEREVREARQEAARDTRNANESVIESYGRLRGDAKLTSQELLAELEKQVRDQEQWASNLISLAGRVPDAMLEELATLGPGAAGVVAAAADMSDAELRKFIDLHGRSGKEAGATFARNLDDAAPVLREIARQRGEEVADKVREGMDGGRLSVYDAARRVGLTISQGVGTDRQVKITVDTSEADATMNAWLLKYSAHISQHYADGGIAYFAGGAENHVAQIAGPGITRVWAEPETGGEAYIPLAMSKRGRSEEILSEVAERFGGRFYKTLPVSRGSVSAGGGGMYRPAPVYNITVNGGLDSGAEIGARVVASIQAYEQGSGAAWRRSA